MIPLLLVGLGGFVGSVLRYSTTIAMTRCFPDERFPYGTLIVNTLGCLAIGFLGARSLAADSPGRWFVIIGVLGGFTTFSSFGFETYALAHESGPWPALANVSLQVCCGLAAVWAGAWLARV